VNNLIEPIGFRLVGDALVTAELVPGSPEAAFLHALIGGIGGYIAGGERGAIGGALGGFMGELILKGGIDPASMTPEQIDDMLFTQQLIGMMASIMAGDESMSGIDAAVNGFTYNALGLAIPLVPVVMDAFLKVSLDILAAATGWTLYNQMSDDDNADSNAGDNSGNGGKTGGDSGDPEKKDDNTRPPIPPCDDCFDWGWGEGEDTGRQIIETDKGQIVVGGGAQLEHLNPADIARIQNAANRTGQEITVVGSRAGGTAGPSADWDYLMSGNSAQRHSATSSVPRGISGGALDSREFSGRDVWSSRTNPLDTSKPYIIFRPK
jgi:hypothetical protein